MVALTLPFPTPERARLTPLAPARTWLTDTGFIDHQRALVRDTEPLFELLRNSTQWRSERRTMYDRVVDVPRLLGRLPDSTPPVLRQLRERLDAYYRVTLDRVHLARYRDGHDSVAWHGDRIGIHRPWSVIAILSLGGTRRFLVRPAGGGPSQRFDIGSGDLLVMAGDLQQTHEHCVPKQAHAQPRIAVMFRHSQRWTVDPTQLAQQRRVLR